MAKKNPTSTAATGKRGQPSRAASEKKSHRKNLESPELYINRELSWLEFNDRVLQEGLSKNLPLLQRLKFLAIVSSNLDEFFLVRVAGLKQQVSAKVDRRDVSGLTPAEQISAIARRAHRMAKEQSAGIREVLDGLARHGLRVFERPQWTDEQRQFLRSYFSKQITAVLTPLAMEELDPRPLLPSLKLYVAAIVRAAEAESSEGTVVVVGVPAQFPRFVTIAAAEGLQLARLEDVMLEHLATVFPGCEILASAVFRITRDADVPMQDDDASDLLQAVEEAVLARRRRAAVRLEVSADPDPRLKQWLVDWLRLGDEDVYEIKGTLDATAFMEIADWPGLEGLMRSEQAADRGQPTSAPSGKRSSAKALKEVDWPPQIPCDLLGTEDLWGTLGDRDVLLFHPYESFDPVVRLLEQAADDPNVLAIKQTLYRTSGDSPIVRALQRAAEQGKEVTVLVELKARFDEARNVNWARRLEDAGCHVVYGIVGLKTHAKALLIVRSEGGRIRRYVHLATGNYNDRTARIYSDVGLMTCDRDLAADVAAFFNLLTGYSEAVGWSKLSVAPTGLRQRFVELIDREVHAATPDQPGLIMAKTNSLQDPDICRALYRASQAGVKVLLNVRGICCLRPGLKGISKRIEVRSIVDRFLEHARIFCFRNGGHEEVYLSSADWMARNLSKRLEILFPVSDPRHRQRLIDVMQTLFADNVKARRLLPDGTYEPVARKGKRVRAQQEFYDQAVAAVRSAEQTAMQFRPLRRPEGA